MQENTGVICLNDDDCSWIEKFACANLILEDEFLPTYDTKLNFDYLYVQSYVIRTYLLLCHIKYQHIAQKYMFFVPRKITNVVTMNDDDMFKLDENYSMPLETDWRHLYVMPIDQLYPGYNILRQIASTLKNEPCNRSDMRLFEYIETIEDKDQIIEKLNEYKVQDFQLCHMNHVGKLYKDLIRRFEHLFSDTSPLLQMPMLSELSEQLNNILKKELIDTDDNNGDKTIIVQKLQSNIEDIDRLLEDLKNIEDTLVQQAAKPLAQTCTYMSIENSILSIIPEEIKCENYVSLNIQLIQVRSKLQEKTINIEEENTKQWNENFDEESNQIEQQIRGNRFRPTVVDDTEQDDWEGFTRRIEPQHSDDEINQSKTDESVNEQVNESNKNELSSPIIKDVQIPSLFELTVEPISITSLAPISENYEQSPIGVSLKTLMFDIATQPDEAGPLPTA
ncbi:unnamed protein product [Rotaria sp. Silwood1]|nr:unnamed protein product [Rotaria sp. Silwood1]CAF5018660.1 unnamed protein product [Rotaria sp. Silwood1]